MILFEEIMKARKKSQYAIGKHPNSHRRKGSVAPPAAAEVPVVADPPKALVNASAAIGRAYKGVDMKLTASDISAVEAYQSYGFAYMNYAMRMGRGNPNGPIQVTPAYRRFIEGGGIGLLKKNIQAMKDMLDRSPAIDAPIKVYRAVGDGAVLFAPAAGWNGARDKHRALYNQISKEGVRKRLETMVGKEFVDHGFISTTTDEKQAVMWANRHLGNGGTVLFEITAPKGTRGLSPRHTDGLSEKGTVVKKEWIMRHGTKFKIKGVKPHPNDSNMTVVSMEAVP